MLRPFKYLICCLLLASLLGCSGLPGGPAGLPGSATPVVSMVPGPGATLPAVPSPAPTGTPTLPPATANPAGVESSTVTPTATLGSPDMALRISVPGPMSKVVSPIDFMIYILPAFTGSTRIQLLGEDGRELFSKSFRTFPNIDNVPTRVEEKIKFEIHGVAEIGRLQISTVDSFGRMQAFNSVRLLLLSMGDQVVSPPYQAMERVLLRTPAMDDQVSGGVLVVDGEIQPVNDTPVLLELYDAQGNVIGSRILTLRPADGTYQAFSTTISYQTSQAVAARLMIRQVDDRISGLAYLYSVSLQVGP